MRKWFWRCTLAWVASVGCVYLAADYASRNGASWVGRGVTAVSEGIEIEVEFRASGGRKETVEVEETEPVREPDVPTVAVTHVPELLPARLPGQILLDDESSVEPPRIGALPRIRSLIGGPTVTGAFEESEAALILMPYVGEEYERLGAPKVEVEREVLAMPCVQ